jgi:cell division transport system ATP-binding protein
VAKLTADFAVSMIEFQDVSKTYGPGLRALNEISLTIGSGELAFLCGPSGAGKSTLLKLVIREEEPSAGRIWIDGQNISKLGTRGVLSLRRRIGLLLQPVRLLSGLTVLENIALAAEVTGEGKKNSRSKAERVLHNVELYERRAAMPATLSAGEQQRVALARALVNDPKLILADEPTGNFDIAASDELMRPLVRARERGATVVVASHDLRLANHYGDRVLILERGELLDGPCRAQAVGADL